MSIDSLIERILGTNVFRCEQIIGKGETNQVFKVEAGEKNYILRLNADEPDELRFRKEAWCADAAIAAGVLSAQVLKYGAEPEGAYSLLAYIPGQNGEDTPPAVQSEIWRKLGEYLKRIYHIPVTGFEENMTEPGVFDGSWAQYLQDNINDSAGSKYANVVPAEQLKVVQAALAELAETNFEFGLTHYDVALKNTRYTPTGDLHLIDWGSAGVRAAPHMDIAEILNSSLSLDDQDFQHFLAGYGLSGEEFAAIYPEILQLDVLVAFDKLRWAIDRSPADVQKMKTHLKKVVEQLENYQRRS